MVEEKRGENRGRRGEFRGPKVRLCQGECDTVTSSGFYAEQCRKNGPFLFRFGAFGSSANAGSFVRQTSQLIPLEEKLAASMATGRFSCALFFAAQNFRSSKVKL